MATAAEMVWRHLLTGAFDEERRRWDSVSAVARELELPISTVHDALSRPAKIGALAISGHALRVIHPWRLLMLWAARRDLARDVTASTTTSLDPFDTEQSLMEHGLVIGGFGGIVARLTINPIASYDTVLAYGAPVNLVGPGQTTVVFLDPDPLLDRYGPIAPSAQCFVDLFNTPGWQAARFVEYLALSWMDADVA